MVQMSLKRYFYALYNGHNEFVFKQLINNILNQNNHQSINFCAKIGVRKHIFYHISKTNKDSLIKFSETSPSVILNLKTSK